MIDWNVLLIVVSNFLTAYNEDNSHDSILAGGSMKVSDPFDIGSGHIDPLKALDPGLVYDLKTSDYILYLCNCGYTEDQIRHMVLDLSPSTDWTSCPRGHTINTNINYPSVTISNRQLRLRGPFETWVRRKQLYIFLRWRVLMAWK